jgi:hypothetical protein
MEHPLLQSFPFHDFLAETDPFFSLTIVFFIAIFHTKIKIFNTELAYYYPGGGMGEAARCLLNYERDWYINYCETYRGNTSTMH